jgi:hypothetical protein
MTPAAAAVHTTEPRARFQDLLAAEWIKLRSLRSTYWGLALFTVFVIGSSVDAAYADYRNWPWYSAAMRAHFSPLWDAFAINSYVVLMLAAGSIGAIAIVSEYSSGLIRTTFAAVPARRSVVAAKATVVAAVMLVVGTFIAVTSFGVSQAILSGRHAGISIGHPGALRALVASALLPPVCAIVGMGIGALVRHTATSIVTTTAVLILLPLFFGDNHRFTADVHHAMPMAAWERLIDIGPQQAHVPYPPTVTGGWIVYAAWPLVAAILAVIVVHRRDV